MTLLALLIAAGCVVAVLEMGRRLAAVDRRIAALEALARAATSGPGWAAVSSPPALPDVRGRSAPDGDRPPVPPPLPPAPAPGALPPPLRLPTRPTLEETLGSRWTVWVGGLALAMGGLFLVRYSIEQDLVGPRLRVTFGLLFATALLVAAEWLRRREVPLRLSAVPSANIPAILTAAGTSTAFGSVYAAYGLYGLIGPALAFVALGLVSFVTMAAAILHGPVLAGFGLVAALASPILVESRDPSPVALVMYLAFAVGTAYAVARLKLWRPLAVAAATGGILWGWGLLAMGTPWQAATLVHVVVQMALAILFLVVDPHRGERDGDAVADRTVAAILFAIAVLAVAATIDLGPDPLRPLFVGALAAMLVGAGFRHPAAAPGLAAAALLAAGALAVWPVASQSAGETTAFVRDLAASPRPEALSLFLTTAVAWAALVGAGGLARLALGRDLRAGPAGWYAGAGTLGPLAILIVSYWRITFFDASVPFALAAAGLGVLFALAAGLLRRLDPEDASAAIRLGLGAAASAAVAALAAGLTFAFDKGVLTVTLALAALGTSMVAERARVPVLRHVVGALGITVAARLAWDPSVMQGDIGTTPVVNWLLWGYGVPALAFGLATRVLARGGRDRVVRFVESLSWLFAVLLVFLEIRHALHAGQPFTARSNHVEAGLVVTEALGFTLLALRLDGRWPDPLYRVGSLVFGALSLAGAAYSLGLHHNPYLSGEPILGGAVVNSLLPAYLIPAMLAAAVAAAGRLTRPRPFVLAAASLALLLELAYSLLEVRRLFVGPSVGFLGPAGDTELWCYSLVLLANGAVLLAYGLLRGVRDARWAAAACLIAAVLKVFVVDLSTLQGLARALSFVGLGLALVVVGFVYQRLVAGRPSPAT